MYKKIFLPILLLNILACSSPKKTTIKPVVTIPQTKKVVSRDLLISSSESSRPGWTNNSHIKNSTGEHFIGFSSGNFSVESGKAKALSNAFETVSKFVNVTIKSESSSYSESSAKYANEYVVNSSKEVGAEIDIKDFTTKLYSEKWNRSNSQQHDVYVMLTIPHKQMHRISVERDGIAAWGINGGKCESGDAEEIIKEIAIKKGWSISPEMEPSNKIQNIQGYFARPKTSFLLSVDHSCSQEKKLTFNYYSLFKKKIMYSFSASGSDYKTVKEQLLHKLFSYRKVLPDLEIPPATKGVDKIDVKLLKAYDIAFNSDNEGMLFTNETIIRWQTIATWNDTNPFKENAEKRVQIWTKFRKDYGRKLQKRSSDKNKLIEILKSNAISLKDKTILLKEFIYNYATLFGMEDILEIVSTLKEKKDRSELYRSLFTKELISEWKSLCKNGDSAACYFAGFISNDKVKYDFFKTACNGNIGHACYGVGKIDEKKLSWGNASDNAQKACSLGIVKACFSIGNLYYKGKVSGTIDMPKAIKYLDKACIKNHSVSCAYLGWIYKHGEGVAADIAQSTVFLKKSCSLGYNKACSFLQNPNND